jgi:hypothetical protein
MTETGNRFLRTAHTNFSTANTPQTDLPLQLNCRKSRFAGSTNNRNTINMTGVASSISLKNNNTFIQNYLQLNVSSEPYF